MINIKANIGIVFCANIENLNTKIFDLLGKKIIT